MYYLCCQKKTHNGRKHTYIDAKPAQSTKLF